MSVGSTWWRLVFSHVFTQYANEGVVEVLQAPIYNDISVAQWLGLTPKQVVKDHLGFSDETLERLPQVKPYILPGDPDLSKTNFTETEV
jgi:hypothetical protein